MEMPGRHASLESYRYGFNGMEKDDEVKGVSGTSYTTEFRQLDTRLGRWFTIDPVVKYHESPYATFANNPIWFVDPNGADTTRNELGGLIWKVEKGDTYWSIGEKLKEYGIYDKNEYKNIQSMNSVEATSLEIGSLLDIMWIHYVYQGRTPNQYAISRSATIMNPQWNFLTFHRERKLGNENRTEACLPCSGCNAVGLSPEEFPYASTLEGGFGAWCGCVPLREQKIQAGQLGSLSRAMNKAGGFNRFAVVHVPTTLVPAPEPVPVPTPVPVTEPENKPVTKPILTVPKTEPVPVGNGVPVPEFTPENAAKAGAGAAVLTVILIIVLLPIGL